MGTGRMRLGEDREKDYCLLIIFEIFFIVNPEIKTGIIKFVSFGFFLKFVFV